MSESELHAYVRAVSKARGLPLDEAWVPAIALHLRRLLDAAAVLDEARLDAADPAPKFEP
jgi:hypothetical protein